MDMVRWRIPPHFHHAIHIGGGYRDGLDVVAGTGLVIPGWQDLTGQLGHAVRAAAGEVGMAEIGMPGHVHGALAGNLAQDGILFHGVTFPPKTGPPDPARSAVPMPARPSISASHVATRDCHGMPLYPFHTRQRIVRTTAYTCDEADHLIYGDRSAIGTTLRASGEIRSAAADWAVYPPGTTFSIKGLPGVYVVDDYGSALTGTGTIDIYQPDQRAMARWGSRTVEITVIRWGSLTRGAAILRGRQGAGHCREMLAAILRYRRSESKIASR